MSEQTYKLAAAALLCTTILAGVLAIQYNGQLQSVEHEYELLLEELEDNTVVISIRVNFGDETVTWFNDTRVPLGTNFLNATGMISEIELQSSEWGVFLNSIDGVGGEPNSFWLWDYYDEGWQTGPVGADQWIVHDGDILSWTYTSFE
ncbi:DUF4430 domain-containing protein [Candidatus Bathyarchaeota archaeon]|nr:DUF4430 domain-containing protein [Candidatus Bathyarchaeota archaeon]